MFSLSPPPYFITFITKTFITSFLAFAQPRGRGLAFRKLAFCWHGHGRRQWASLKKHSLTAKNAMNGSGIAANIDLVCFCCTRRMSISGIYSFLFKHIFGPSRRRSKTHQNRRFSRTSKRDRFFWNIDEEYIILCSPVILKKASFLAFYAGERCFCFRNQSTTNLCSISGYSNLTVR